MCGEGQMMAVRNKFIMRNSNSIFRIFVNGAHAQENEKQIFKKTVFSGVHQHNNMLHG